MVDKNGCLRVANFDAYAAYVANLVSYINVGHFIDGSNPAPAGLKRINLLSIYNEPDVSNPPGANPLSTPQNYVDLYVDVAAAIKAVDPTVRIVAGELTYFNSDFAAVFVKGIQNSPLPVAAFAIHNYSIGCTQAGVTENPTDDVVLGKIPPFAGSLQGIYTTLANSPSFQNVPVWVTESNVSYVYDNQDGLNSCDMTPFQPDPRAGKPFFAAWRPDLFSQLAKAQWGALHHWNYFDDVQLGEVNTTNAVPFIAYWVDYFLSSYFHPSTPAATILTPGNLPPNIAELAVRYPDGTLAVMLANIGVDASGRNRAPSSLTLDISQFGPFGAVTKVNIDGCTDVTVAPQAQPVQGSQIAIAFPSCASVTNGYGAAFVLATPATNTISFTAPNPTVFGVPSIPLTATSSSMAPVSFASDTMSACTVSGSMVTILATGTCSITATQPANVNFPPSMPVTQSFVISKAGQVVTFGPLSNQTVSTAPFPVSATVSPVAPATVPSPLPVSFASTTTAICTVSGSTVTIMAAGLCSITGSVAGNANYLPSANVTQSFTVFGASPSEPGVFRQNFAFFLNKTGNDVFNSPGDYIYYNFVAPQAGDKPVVGDWTGSGTTKIGIFRSGTWFLDLNGDGVFTPGVDAQFTFGQAGDTPVVGDWTGNGKSKIGIVRPFTAGGPPALWVLDYDGNGTMSANDLSKAFAYGGVAGDVPIVGDWTGNGIAKVGVVRPFALGGVPAFWLLDANNDHAIDTGDLIFAFGGIQGDIPIAGDWNRSGTSKVGVVRPFSPGTPAAFWLLDGNGSAPTVPGSNDLVYFPFGGIAGDVPVVGKW